MLKWFEKARTTTTRDVNKKIDEIDKESKAYGMPVRTKGWYESHKQIILSLDEMVERAKYLEESISEYQNMYFLLSKNSNYFDALVEEFNSMEVFLENLRKKVYRFVDPVLSLSDNHIFDSHIFVMLIAIKEYKRIFSGWHWESIQNDEEYLNNTLKLFKHYLDGKYSYGESLQEDFRKTSFRD